MPYRTRFLNAGSVLMGFHPLKFVTAGKKFLSAAMGRGKANSFKPHGKDKSKIAAAAAKKKGAKKNQNAGIIRGRVETPKTERKVNSFS
jgi:hypothetical protein